MKKSKLDRIINLIKEQMTSGAMPTNHTGKEIANFDPVMGATKRRKNKYIYGGHGSRRNWMKDKKDG